MTDHRTLKDLSSDDLDNLSIEEWAAIAKRTEPAAVVDLVVSCTKGEITRMRCGCGRTGDLPQPTRPRD